MKTALTSAAAFALAAVAGWTGVALWPAPAPPPVPAAIPGEPIVVRPLATCPEEPKLFDDLSALQEAVAAKSEQLDVARAQEELTTGKALEWPTNLPEGFDEQSLERLLLDVADEHGGELIGVDCGEYPCVAVIGWNGAQFDAKTAARLDLSMAMPSSSWGGEMVWSEAENLSEFIRGEAAGGVSFTVALLPPGKRTEEENARIAFRTAEASSIFNPMTHDYADAD